MNGSVENNRFKDHTEIAKAVFAMLSGFREYLGQPKYCSWDEADQSTKDFMAMVVEYVASDASLISAKDIHDIWFDWKKSTIPHTNVWCLMKSFH